MTQRPIKGNRTTFRTGHKGFTGTANGIWKGDKVKYSALHAWVVRQFGSPRLCAICFSTTAKKYEWANVSGKYHRSLLDWARLCVSCHRRLDGHGFKAWAKRRQSGKQPWKSYKRSSNGTYATT